MSPSPPRGLYAIAGLIHSIAILTQTYNTYLALDAVYQKRQRSKSKKFSFSFDTIFALMNCLIFLYESMSFLLCVPLLGKETGDASRGLMVICAWSYYGCTFVYAVFVVRRYGRVYAVLEKGFGKYWFPLLQAVVFMIWCGTGLPICLFDLVSAARHGRVPSSYPQSISDSGIILTFVWNCTVLVVDVGVSSLLFFRLRRSIRERKYELPKVSTKKRTAPVVPATNNMQSADKAWTPESSANNLSHGDLRASSSASHIPLDKVKSSDALVHSTNPSFTTLPNASIKTLPTSQLTAPRNNYRASRRLQALLLRRTTIAITFLVCLSLSGALLALICDFALRDESNPYAYGYQIVAQISYTVPVYHARFAWIYVKAVKALTKDLRA